MAESKGEITVKEMQIRIYMSDKYDSVRKGRTDLCDFDVSCMHDLPNSGRHNEIVRKLGITAFIGVSGYPGLINKEMVQNLGKNAERPIDFALSNPTSKAECSAQQSYECSNNTLYLFWIAIP
jgi:malate dehydrogenase (oxaloacetate-decarboxylating)(NADP+)